MEHLQHPIPPLYDAESRILILGSFPSRASRKAAFFYGHPQNRFWKTVSALLGCECPQTTEEKAAMLHEHHIALWDTIASCDIENSSDASIRNARPNDLSPILRSSAIRAIFCNGAASYELYCRYVQPENGIAAQKLPSTSPANAAWSQEKLLSAWRCILEYL